MLVGFFACKKTANENTATPLEASTTTAKQAEPVLFKMNNAPANSAVQWSVTPNKNVQINVEASNYSKEAAILFGAAGKYTVSATAGDATASSLITIDSTFFAGPKDTTVIMPLANDSLALKPSVFGSGDSSGLVISAVTTKKYNCLNNFLVSKVYKDAMGYTIVYSGVSIPKDCKAGKAKAQAMDHLIPVAEGYYLLKVIVNGIKYQGSFIKKDNKYTFSWSNDVVSLSPLVVQ